MHVRHGTAVEVTPEGFVEGAWDAEFAAFEFDRAEVLAGSGARLRSGTLVFASPFHPLERLFVLRTASDVLVSNSIVFLLTQAADALDSAHQDYFFDFVRQVRRGIIGPPITVPTARGRRIELYPCCNLELGADLSLRRTPKECAAAPADFAAYDHQLVTAITNLARNAASPLRRRQYRLVAACSRGYDSAATAALAHRAGCREGVTFSRSAGVMSGHAVFRSTEGPGDDSGADVLRALGMRIREYDRGDLMAIPGHPRAEFFISPGSTTDASTRVMENVVAGSVFVSGRHGERYWGPTRRCRRRHLREVDDCMLSGHALGEFRLRADFVHLPVPYISAVHGPAIHRITHAPEMRPWSLGRAYYDRPIARRLAEEAGVPRLAFGQTKRGGAFEARALGPDSERDFQAFVRDHVPDAIRRRLDGRPLRERQPAHRRMAHFRVHYAHWPLASAVLDVLQFERLHMLWNSIYLYQFHWGAARTGERYAVAPPMLRA